MNTKKYWLIFGIVFFLISLVIYLYITQVVFRSAYHIYAVNQPQPFNINDYARYMPGFGLIKSFAIYKPGGAITGPILISLIYGVIGGIIGWIYGKIKNRSKIG